MHLAGTFIQRDLQKRINTEEIYEYIEEILEGIPLGGLPAGESADGAYAR